MYGDLYGDLEIGQIDLLVQYWNSDCQSSSKMGDAEWLIIATTIMLGLGCAKSGKLGNHAFKSPETPTDIG